MASSIKTIAVVGLGYIGLPTAAMFAAQKVHVVGIDVDQRIVDTINQGQIHIVEPGLEAIVHHCVSEGYLRATTRPEAADAFLIAVPTPFKPGHIPDLTYIEAATKALAPVLAKGNVVILESTSPVGATEQMVEWLRAARPDLTFPDFANRDSVPDVHIAHCPERVLPGHVIRELVENDRIIGGMTKSCSERAADVYRVFVKGQLFYSDARTAEMAKLTENAFRDVNIAFANELSVICDTLSINVWELIRLANQHPRVNILQPGCGVGGHCIAVDPWFIVNKSPEEARLIRTAREVNDGKPEWVKAKVRNAVQELISQTGAESEKDLTIACLGLAFKADIDDLRESPALKITMDIADEFKGTVLAVEPNIIALPEKLRKKNVSLRTAGEAIEEADILLLLVDHSVFRTVERDMLQGKQIVDTRGVWG